MFFSKFVYLSLNPLMTETDIRLLRDDGEQHDCPLLDDEDSKICSLEVFQLNFFCFGWFVF